MKFIPFPATLLSILLNSVLFGILFALPTRAQHSPQNQSPSTTAQNQVSQTQVAQTHKALRAVLQEQAFDWNNGDIAAFMKGYEESDSLRFMSGGTVRRGWKTVLERYKTSYPDKSAMGLLAFTDLEITLLSPESAYVVGKWRLKRDKDEPNGLFTLIFRKTAQGWKIIHDHTSSAQ